MQASKEHPEDQRVELSSQLSRTFHTEVTCGLSREPVGAPLTQEGGLQICLGTPQGACAALRPGAATRQLPVALAPLAPARSAQEAPLLAHELWPLLLPFPLVVPAGPTQSSPHCGGAQLLRRWGSSDHGQCCS